MTTMAHLGAGPEQRPVRILIVEDHPALRGVVRLACESDPSLAVVGEATTGEAALEMCGTADPDVVVLDLGLPGMGGTEVARRMRQAGSRAKILILAGPTDDDRVFECIRIGVDGYLGKSAGAQQITVAIGTIARGGRVFTPEQEARARDQLGAMARRAREASQISATVTARELEILELISVGLTMKQVGTRLGISPRTVETHIAKLYRKLGVGTRVQAIARAASLGLIDLEGFGR